MFLGCFFYYYKEIANELVTSVKIKQNPTNKLTKSELRLFLCFGLSKGSHYMHWRSLLTRIVEKPMNKPAGIAKLAMIVASLIPYIVVKRRKFLEWLKLDKLLEYLTSKPMRKVKLQRISWSGLVNCEKFVSKTRVEHSKLPTQSK